MWGSDWPHPRMEGEMPDAGHLLDLFNAWTPDDGDAPPHPRRQSGAALRLSRVAYGGQIYPVPLGFLKQPTDSGRSSFGR